MSHELQIPQIHARDLGFEAELLAHALESQHKSDDNVSVCGKTEIGNG